MAFPQLAASNGGYGTKDTDTHTINLPADISADDLLLVFLAVDGDTTITFPEGWTELFSLFGTGAVLFGCWYRVADGGEGASITVTTSSREYTAHTSHRITDYTGTPEAGTPSTAGSANPDPPSLTPTWGALDTLWVACEGDDGKTITAYPTDYSNGRNDVNPSPRCGVGTATRELNSTSEDPGTFTLNSPDQWVANTVAIQPEAVAFVPKVIII